MDFIGIWITYLLTSRFLFNPGNRFLQPGGYFLANFAPAEPVPQATRHPVRRHLAQFRQEQDCVAQEVVNFPR